MPGRDICMGIYKKEEVANIVNNLALMLPLYDSLGEAERVQVDKDVDRLHDCWPCFRKGGMRCVK